jgi:hypothetical protein
MLKGNITYRLRTTSLQNHKQTDTPEWIIATIDDAAEAKLPTRTPARCITLHKSSKQIHFHIQNIKENIDI